MRYLLIRSAQACGSWLLAVVLVFIAVRVLPGHPLLSRFGQHPDAAQIAKLSAENGWDRPLVFQLGDFLRKLLTTGDLGGSIARGTSVNAELRERLPATIELTFAATCLGVPIGLAVGILTAWYQGRWIDHVSSAAALLGVSVPVFFIALVLRESLPAFPTSQRLPASAFDFEPLTGLYLLDTLLRGRFDLWCEALRHIALPAITLATVPAASIAKISRASMLETLARDFIRTAKAKGASSFRILWKHALADAAVPIANIGAFQIGLLLSGAVLTETVFAWPGLGKYLADAVVNDRDYAVVQAGAIAVAAMFAVMNLLLDVAFTFLDPRLRLERTA